MTKISKFIENVYGLRNEEDFEYGSYFDFVNNEARLNEIIKKESLLIFHSDEELIDYIGTLFTKKHLKNNYYLHERGVDFYKQGYFNSQFRIPIEHYLRIYTLEDIGIKRFCISHGHEYLVVRYECIPYAERMLIDNFINKCCIEKVIEKLCFRSIYEIKEKKIPSFPFNMITVSCELKHINSIEQLKMFLYAYNSSNFYLNKDLLTKDLLIEKEYINLSYDDIPKYINMDIFYQDAPSYNAFGNELPGKITTFNIRFITMLNIDKSLSLKPHPEDLVNAIKKAIISIEPYLYIDKGFLFVPSRVINLFSFLCKNKIESKYGLIEKVLDKNESLKIGRDIDSLYYDFDEETNTFFEFSPHDVRFAYLVQNSSYIAIKTKEIK